VDTFHLIREVIGHLSQKKGLAITAIIVVLLLHQFFRETEAVLEMFSSGGVSGVMKNAYALIQPEPQPKSWCEGTI
jgi:uncharacterized membrane protein YjjP (DUF1212 family)